jgi:eukaryotic-like serine/threonine-protein kinase
MELFHNRYQLEQAWKEAEGGDFVYAKDLKLNRSVLLWRTSVREEKQKETILRRLGNAARFADRRFVHILDVSVAGEDLYAVLTRDNGSFLSDKLRDLNWSGQEILEHLRVLCPAIREARKDRLHDFSVSAENIWLDGEGRLQFINSWTDGGTDRRDVRGLALLLYQLCARSLHLPTSMAQYNQALQTALTGLPGGDPKEASEWAGSAFLPSCTLRDYESRMNRLLEPLPSAPAPSAPSPVPSKRMKTPVRREEPAMVRVPAQDAKRPPAASSPEPERLAVRLRPWIIFSLVVFCIGMLGVAGLWYAIRPQSDDSRELTLPSEHVAASVSTPTPAGSQASGGHSSKPTVSPANSSATVKPSDAPRPAENAIVPDLTNRTLDEASKLALQAGLKYQYLLEPNEMEKGKVFKQDLAPGAPVAKGDKIVFWVSKGK